MLRLTLVSEITPGWQLAKTTPHGHQGMGEYSVSFVAALLPSRPSFFTRLHIATTRSLLCLL